MSECEVHPFEIKFIEIHNTDISVSIKVLNTYLLKENSLGS